jgi:hypothetical protein
VKQEKMAFLNTRTSEGFCTSLSKISSYAFHLMGLCNGQMVKVSTSPVMPAQSRADNHAVLLRHKAHARIASQIGFDLFSFISAAQADILKFFPESDDFVKVVDGHWVNHDCHK